MLISHENLHDLKNERGDVLPPLPVALRLVPILFYLSALGAVILVVITFLQIGHAAGQLENTRRETAEAKAQIAQTQASRTALEARTKHAADLLQWVEGSVGLQSLTVEISRSMTAKSAINELSFSRDEKNNSQLQFALKLQTADPSQLETTIEAIRKSTFRPFSAKQSQEGNRISYEATLIREVPTLLEASPGK